VEASGAAISTSAATRPLIRTGGAGLLSAPTARHFTSRRTFNGWSSTARPPPTSRRWLWRGGAAMMMMARSRLCSAMHAGALRALTCLLARPPDLPQLQPECAALPAPPTPLPLQLNSCWLAPRSRGPRLACTQDPGAAARRCWPRAGGARGVVVVPVPSRSSTVARAVYFHNDPISLSEALAGVIMSAGYRACSSAGRCQLPGDSSLQPT
jgi:hypothetical protein